MNKKRICKIWVVLLPIIAVSGFIFLKIFADDIIGYFRPCPFYEILGIQCSGCGNTRSVMALLRGDIISSLKYNISPVLISVMLILLYIELVTMAFGNHKRILPRKGLFWIIFGVVLMGYFIGRNFI